MPRKSGRPSPPTDRFALERRRFLQDSAMATAGAGSLLAAFGAVTLVFVLKTWFFSLTVAIMPMASGLYAPLRRHRLGGAALGGFARMFAVLLVIEVISLMGNYY